MRAYPISGTILFLFLAVIMLGCKAKPGDEKIKTKDSDMVESKEEWHMMDQVAKVQVGPAEEEAFRQAAFGGELEGIKNFLDQGVDCNVADQGGATALMYAAFNGHSDVVIYLIDKGALVDQRDFMDRTALLYGATGPFPETVKILLDKGAEPNVVDNNEHFSPLMHAASEGHLEVVKVLLQYGADSSLKDIDGDDASSFARQAGHIQVADYLKNAR